MRCFDKDFSLKNSPRNLLENLKTARLSTVLSDANVTTRDFPPIIHDDLGFVAEHLPSEAHGASITIDEPPLNPSYTRMIVMKLQEHAVVTSTTTMATETAQTSSIITAPVGWIDFPAYPMILIAILIGLSMVAGMKRGGGNQN